ncbi:glycoside hydrolase family 13 protein, partial [Butyricicoccus pullicaecorum]|uniref:glycoside hydrolase family 13 protein n=1 Tax=Butyricicoccus pullicaecorum TaxID=501571 RepID=UPI00399070DF
SNHRYDTGNYKNIDPMMGTEEDFKELCAEAKKRGMRVILDGVFSHNGYDSVYFNARGHYDSVGAFQSQESPYYEWYDFSHWPDQYSSWWGIYTLPQVNELNSKYLDYIIEDEDSVIRRWLRLGASGWRLDVADELPDEFIAKLNAAARREKPDALVVGEVWEDASNKISYSVRRRYFQGGELDSVMNYPLRDGVMSFLGGSPAEDFAEKMECLRENYPRAVFYNLMNIIGTHDTPRALTVMGAKPEDWSGSRDHRARARLIGEDLIAARRKMYLAAVIQFTMPGSPTIYYGDEAGLQGFEDPFNRRTYPWGNEDGSLLDFYRKLCAVRTQSSALTDGEIAFRKAEGGLLIYERWDAQEHLYIVINRDDEAVVRLPCHAAEDLLDDQTRVDTDTDDLVLRIPACSARILRVTE